MYRFITLNQFVFTVNIASWNTNIHFDGVISYNYTLINYNDGNINNLMRYDNINGNDDVRYDYGRGLSQIVITLEVDGVQCADVSRTNPCFLEIEFSE